MRPMNVLLGGFMALVTLAWAWDLQYGAGNTGASLPWLVRQEGLYLTGLMAISLMSLAVFLAARPGWLERPLGGLDKMYRGHKWAGILAVAFASLHWLIELSDDLLKAWVGREGRIAEENYNGLLEAMRDLAEDLGEWAIYAILAMLALTLWKRFPYRPWRFLHQVMPVIYLALAFHAVLLAPAHYWGQPTGWLLGLLILTGSVSAGYSLAGRIGRARRVDGTIIAIEHPAPDIVTVHCRLDRAWRGHRPGQFAFIRFDHEEAPHPFTIACADHGDRTISFQIKALGDYTGSLPNRLKVGQPVSVEGPYGRFDIARLNPGARQIWVAGGIGITPFLAWLDSLATQAGGGPVADLHYCTRDRQSDAFVARLEALCAPLPGIRLRVHGAKQGEILTAAMVAGEDRQNPAEVWFCGPQGLAEHLQSGLRMAIPGRFRFHQEAFEIR